MAPLIYVPNLAQYCFMLNTFVQLKICILMKMFEIFNQILI